MTKANSFFFFSFCILMALNAFAQTGQQRPAREHDPRQQAPSQPGPGQQIPQQQIPQQPVPLPPVAQGPSQLPPQQQFPQQQFPQQQGRHHGPGDRGPVPPVPQRQLETISERVFITTRMFERLQLASLLRLSRQQEDQLQVTSVSIIASSLRPSARLDLSSRALRGQTLGSGIVGSQLQEIRINLFGSARISDLELVASDDIFIDSLTVQVLSTQQWPPRLQPAAPNSLLTLQVNQDIRNMGEIQLDRLVEQQLGITLQGASIDRVVVQASPIMMGQGASMQVELNNRLVGQIKYVSSAQMATPFPLNSFEQVFSLSLVVRGSARINSIHIRVGQGQRGF